MPTLQDAYQIIKNLEQTRFPIPASHRDVVIGTFDAASGNFRPAAGVRAVTETTGIDFHGHPIRETSYTVSVNAVNVGLTFVVINRQGDFSVTARTGEDTTVSAPPGQDTITVDVGRTDLSGFELQSGSQSFASVLVLIRPPLIGVGAFQIPALPFLLVYDPPRDTARRNTARYTDTRSVGSSTSVSFTSSRTATTNFLSPQAFVDKINQLLRDVGGSGAANNPFSQGMQGILDALGSGSFSSSDATQDTTDNSLALALSTTVGITAESHSGPGLGDVIVYLHNAKLVWVANGGASLTLLGWDRVVLITVQDLNSKLQRLGNSTDTDPDTGLNRDSIQNLVNIDPFITGESLQNNPRFVSPEGGFDSTVIEVFPGTGFSKDIVHRITQEDKSTFKSSHTETEDFRPGWLGVLFDLFGGSSGQRVETTLSQSVSKSVSAGSETRAAVDLHAGPNDHYAFRIYYDRIFGTFAFETVPVSQTPTVTGRVLAGTGEPIANQLVTLMAGADRFLTITDANGHFSFSTSNKAKGKIMLTAGTFGQTIHLGSGLASRDVTLREQSADHRQQAEVSSGEYERIQVLERENRELRQENEILKAASALFARQLDPRLPKP